MTERAQLRRPGLQITFRHMAPLPRVRLLVAERVDQLQRLYGPLLGCQVVVEAPGKLRRYGAPVAVRVDLQLPRNDHLRTNHLAKEHHCDVYTALRDAFDSLKRMIHSGHPQPTGAELDMTIPQENDQPA